MIYEALEDRLAVDTDGTLHEVRRGQWIRTPGPDEVLVELFGDDLVVVHHERQEEEAT